MRVLVLSLSLAPEESRLPDWDEGGAIAEKFSGFSAFLDGQFLTESGEELTLKVPAAVLKRDSILPGQTGTILKNQQQIFRFTAD